MNVLKAKYEILTPISEGGTAELKHIERIGRVCYKSEDKITEDGESARKFVKMLINNHHEAMIEHSTLSVLFTVDRGVSHEMVRHRIASFAQESTRYVNYAKDKFGSEIAVIDIQEGIERDSKMKNMDADNIGESYVEWLNAMKDAEKHYMAMIELGATPQIARSVLPNSTKTNITITANYREWRTFFKLRTAPDAHPQIRDVAIPLLNELKQRIPVVFDDIEAARESLDRVHEFVRNHPTVYISTHSPQGYENLEAKRVMDLDNPVPTVLAEVDFSKSEGTGKYVCSVCGYVYDPAENDGVAFEDLPDDWKCPRCKQPKEKFNKA